MFGWLFLLGCGWYVGCGVGGWVFVGFCCILVVVCGIVVLGGDWIWCGYFFWGLVLCVVCVFFSN